MEIPGIGIFTRDEQYGEYYSELISVPVLDGKQCQLILEDYDNDPDQAEFRTAIANFLSIQSAVLEEVEPHIFKYYLDCNANADEEEAITINSPHGVWKHIRLGSSAYVSRRFYGDKKIYVSLSCGCDWEEEHGLQIVLHNGLRVNKIGECDGHLSYADAYGDEQYESVIYPPDR